MYEEILGPEIKPYAPVRVRVGNEHPIVVLKKLGDSVPLPTPKPGSESVGPESDLSAQPAGGIQQRMLGVPVGKGALLQPLKPSSTRELFGSPGGSMLIRLSSVKRSNRSYR